MELRTERIWGGSEPGAMVELEHEVACRTGVGVMFSLSANCAGSAVIWLESSSGCDAGATCDCMRGGEDGGGGFNGDDWGTGGIGNSF